LERIRRKSDCRVNILRIGHLPERDEAEKNVSAHRSGVRQKTGSVHPERYALTSLILAITAHRNPKKRNRRCAERPLSLFITGLLRSYGVTTRSIQHRWRSWCRRVWTYIHACRHCGFAISDTGCYCRTRRLPKPVVLPTTRRTDNKCQHHHQNRTSLHNRGLLPMIGLCAHRSTE
jgi:hypothetical protein